MTVTNTSAITIVCNRCGYTTYSETERDLIVAGWAQLMWSPGEMLLPRHHLCPACRTLMEDFMKGGTVEPQG